jgi:hypothetical protein
VSESRTDCSSTELIFAAQPRSGSSDWEGDGEDTEDESDVPRRELLDAASEQDLY